MQRGQGVILSAQEKITIFMLHGCVFCRASFSDRTRIHERYVFQPGQRYTLEWREPFSGINRGTYRWWFNNSISHDPLIEIPWEITVINPMKQLTFNNFMAYINR